MYTVATMTDITPIAEKAVSFLKSTTNGRLGNTKLRNLLDVTEAVYAKVKEQLLADGTCMAGRGRGGSLILKAQDAPEPTPAPVKEEPVSVVEDPIPHINAKPRGTVPYQVEGRDYDKETADDVVKVFEHRPHGNRSEYCLEVFECLKQYRLTYPGIRNHKQLVDSAIRGQSQVHQGVMTDIHDSANSVLEGVGLALDPNVGLIRWRGGV